MLQAGCAEHIAVGRLERQVGTTLPAAAVGAFHHHCQGAEVLLVEVHLYHLYLHRLVALREGQQAHAFTAGGALVCVEAHPAGARDVGGVVHRQPRGVAADAPRGVDRHVGAEEQRVAAAVAHEVEHRVAHPQAVDGHSTQQGRVVHVEGIGHIATGTAHAGTDGVDGEVAVAHTAPAEVEVHILPAVVAVADEAVAALLSRTGVEHGMPLVKVGYQHRAPLVVGVARTEIAGVFVHHLHIAAIAEVVLQGVVDGGVARKVGQACGSAAALGCGAVVHLQAHATVIHQCGHRLALLHARH